MNFPNRIGRTKIEGPKVNGVVGDRVHTMESVPAEIPLQHVVTFEVNLDRTLREGDIFQPHNSIRRDGALAGIRQ